MKKVPDFLPPRIPVRCPINGGIIPSPTVMNPASAPDPVWMELQVFQSPAIVQGLFMTEVLSPTDRVERYFFGYKCIGCEIMILLGSSVRQAMDLSDYIRHTCDTSELRRAVRGARYMALEKGEHLMEDARGGWGVEKMSFLADRYERKYPRYDAVFSEEQVSQMYDHGIISREQARELLHMQAEMRDKYGNSMRNQW